MAARVAALVLAAGRGRRFGGDGGTTKAVATIGGVPLVRAVALAALRCKAVSVIVVTGHAPETITAALHGLDLRLVHNADYATGMASSLKAGIASLPPEVEGTLVMLADMPFVRPETLAALIARFEDRRVSAVVPVYECRPGNPVLIARPLFDRLRTLSGDQGARRLLTDTGLAIDHCPVDDPGIAIDIDTRAELEDWEAGSTGARAAGAKVHGRQPRSPHRDDG